MGASGVQSSKFDTIGWSSKLGSGMVVAVVRLRSLIVLVPLLVSEGSVATASEPLEAIDAAPPTVVVVPAPLALDVVPSAMGPVELEHELDLERPERETAWLDEVRWTVQEAESVEALASRWGLQLRELVALNPELRGVPTVSVGMQLRVYLHDDERPTRSVGAPNQGRLQHGLPMPDGPHWTLRERRTRAFGARNTIDAMVTAFHHYGQAFDDAPPVSVGEISSRRGGRARPHVSHRTGRDVDLGYLLRPRASAELRPLQWKRADERSFDAEKNWVLIKALVDTGEVQTIFISRKLQRLLEPVARAQLDADEFARYFRVPGQDPQHAPLLRHEDGHVDHMHVRFRCDDDDVRCRSR
jgi:hypothetical protein